MKYLSAPFAKLLTVAACALTLGSCNRAEYAMLPKTSSYHGVARVSTPVPVAPEPAAPAHEAQPVPAATPAAVEAPAAPAADVVATAPAPKKTVEVRRPKAVAAPVAASAASASAVSPATVAATPRKLNLVQRLAVAKVTKQLKKAVNPTTYLQKQNTAEAQKISGNLRTGIILLLVGLLVGIFSKLIGTIIALLGVIFIVLWLLDSL